MSKSVAEQVVVIAGASSGIGRAAALAFAAGHPRRGIPVGGATAAFYLAHASRRRRPTRCSLSGAPARAPPPRRAGPERGAAPRADFPRCRGRGRLAAAPPLTGQPAGSSGPSVGARPATVAVPPRPGRDVPVPGRLVDREQHRYAAGGGGPAATGPNGASIRATDW